MFGASMKPLSFSLALAVSLTLVSCTADGSNEPDPVDDQSPDEQLVEAIRNNDAARIEALVDAGLDVNERLGPLGLSPMAVIAASGNYELIAVVVAAGFDLEAQSRGSGRAALHVAAESGDLELIAALVENGADLERGDDTWQTTAVQYAFYTGQTDAARLLISLGADLDYVDTAGRNTADMAVKGGYSEAIALAEELGLTSSSTE